MIRGAGIVGFGIITNDQDRPEIHLGNTLKRSSFHAFISFGHLLSVQDIVFV
jgi:hypothetical protein